MTIPFGSPFHGNLLLATGFVDRDNETVRNSNHLQRHFPTSAEIHVMGILEKYHRKGIGHQLVKTVEDELRQQGTHFLTVKTLSESRPNKEYDQTRKFYLKAGFLPLEEFKTLWGEANPCLLLVKALGAETAH